MRTAIFFLCMTLLFSNQTRATEYCFLATENNKILESIGDCNTAYAPESTFKIALSLIGFDTGIFKNEQAPSWSLPDGTDPYINICKGSHNPKSWMRDSCLWYSQILTAKLGMSKFQDYVTRLSYGNMDLSGGIAHAWISSSLKISPQEQTAFLQKIANQQFALNKTSYANTKKIMFIQELPGGWKLYGKTGNGKQIDKDHNKTNRQHGWFVGYIEKEKRKIMFASHIADNIQQHIFASHRARNKALIKLWYLIDKIS